MRHLAKILTMEDIADGKVFHEKEIELYVFIPDLSVLNQAKSMDHQEQWSIKVDKAKETIKGSIRVRKIVPSDTKIPQYVLTAKADNASGDRLEVPTPVTEDMFNVFKMISTGGMIKDRYRFPIEGTSLVWEVDMFFNEEGGYHNWAKIDLEGCRGEVPTLPFAVDERIDGRTDDPAQREKISELYSKYFITSKSK